MCFRKNQKADGKNQKPDEKNQKADEKNQKADGKNQKADGKNQKPDEKNQKAVIDNQSGFSKACCALCPCRRKKNKEKVKADAEVEKGNNEVDPEIEKARKEIDHLLNLSASNSSDENENPKVQNVKLRCKKCKWTYKNGEVYENDEKRGRPATQRENDAVEHYMFEWQEFGHDFELEMERRCKRARSAFDKSQSPTSKEGSNRTSKLPFLCHRCRPPPIDQRNSHQDHLN
ncbi:hypothetical protein DdX_09168 [Ditylenchus destructor]|uniref:Uncharacterized protein n=1 Tax=Ditylenchus destructor TaxID=166010 RepID=A0AAD4N6K7_9BILA|nr:hypothetical protein DdX_09168 [Ditylenchus destructor]